jgi:pimeloyl-ACP methyl ester carboxylesterase
VKKLFVMLFAITATVVAQADLQLDSKTGIYSGFVKVKTGKELYVQYVPPLKDNPTVVLLNGLTYSTRDFNALNDALVSKGLGVVRFDFDGMGQTLLKYAPSVAPYPVQTQVGDMNRLLVAMGLKPPYNIVGLSYGGGVGIHFALSYPEKVDNLILMAPFTEPVASQEQWINAQIWATRSMFPYNTYTDDQLYDYFLHQIIYATYPQAEPVVLENPYKLEAIYNLVRGIRKFKPLDSADKLPAGTVHMLVAGKDQYIPRPVLDAFWDKINPKAKMSRIVIDGVEHKMSEVAPKFIASWIVEILNQNPLLLNGNDFVGDPRKGTAKSGKNTIKLDKD